MTLSHAMSPTNDDSSAAIFYDSLTGADSQDKCTRPPAIDEQKRVQTVEGKRLRRLQHIFNSSSGQNSMSARMRLLMSQGTKRCHRNEMLLQNLSASQA